MYPAQCMGADVSGATCNEDIHIFYYTALKWSTYKTTYINVVILVFIQIS